MRYPQAYVYVKSSAKSIDLALIKKWASSPCYFAECEDESASLDQRIKYIVKTIEQLGRRDFRWSSCIVINCSELNSIFLAGMSEHISCVAWINSSHDLARLRSIVSTIAQLRNFYFSLSHATDKYDQIVNTIGNEVQEFKRDEALMQNIRAYVAGFDFWQTHSCLADMAIKTLHLRETKIQANNKSA